MADELFPEEKEQIHAFANKYDDYSGGEIIGEGRKWFERIIEESITVENWANFLSENKSGIKSLDEFLLDQLREVFGEKTYEYASQSDMVFHHDDETSASGTYFSSLNSRDDSDSLWDQIYWPHREAEEQSEEVEAFDWDGCESEDEYPELEYEAVRERDTASSGILSSAFRGLIKAIKKMPDSEIENMGSELANSIIRQVECAVYLVEDDETTDIIMKNDPTHGQYLSYPVTMPQSKPSGMIQPISEPLTLMGHDCYNETVRKLIEGGALKVKPQVSTIYIPVDSYMSEIEKTDFITDWLEVKKRFETILS